MIEKDSSPVHEAPVRPKSARVEMGRPLHTTYQGPQNRYELSPAVVELQGKGEECIAV